MLKSPSHSGLGKRGAAALAFPFASVKHFPVFCAGLTLGCGATFLLLSLLYNSPLSPLVDLYSGSSFSLLPPPPGTGLYPVHAWGFAPRSTHIRSLVRAVRARAPDSIKERCVAIIEGRPGSLEETFAQGAQDWLLFHNFFFHIPYGKGMYLDIGSSHPEKWSNTYFFDKCLGWRGVCIEPNPAFLPLYDEYNRTCKLLNKCVADRPGTKRMDFRGAVHGKGHTVEEVECDTLSHIVAETRMAQADLASIDIEGSEFAVLRCFPFRAFKIATWLIEVDKSSFKLERLFTRSGYVYLGDVLCPWYRLHSEKTRVGVKLDSIFRFIDPTFIFGPPFLPGRPLAGNGPQGPCRAWAKGDASCAEQVPVIEMEEVYPENMTLRDGVCGLPASLSSHPEYTLPTSQHPRIFKA